jgi:hypothetical protein
LHDLYRDAPRSTDDAGRCIGWLRKSIRPTALSEAAFAVLGEGDSPPYVETMMLATSLSNRLEWPLVWAQTAMEAEWKQSLALATQIVEQAEKAARRLVFERASGDRVFDAARAPFERAQIGLPKSSIVALCRRVAQGGSRGARRVGFR